MDTSEQERERADLVEWLTKNGAVFTTEIRDEDDAEIPTFTMANEIKRSAFRDRLALVKEYAARITLDQFVEIDDKEILLYKLKEAVHGGHDNMVYYHGTFYDFDSFMRTAESDEKYYIGNIVLLH